MLQFQRSTANLCAYVKKHKKNMVIQEGIPFLSLFKTTMNKYFRIAYTSNYNFV